MYPTSISELAFVKEHFVEPTVHVGYRFVDPLDGIMHADYSTGTFFSSTFSSPKLILSSFQALGLMS